MLYVDTTNNEVLPASSMTFNNDLATTQADFADLFVGIALESSTSAQSDDITVDVGVESVYEFDCVSATHEVGDAMGPDDTLAALVSLDDQTLVVAVATSSIARVADKKDSATTSVHVSFASTHNPSANHAASVLG